MSRRSDLILVEDMLEAVERTNKKRIMPKAAALACANPQMVWVLLAAIMLLPAVLIAQRVASCCQIAKNRGQQAFDRKDYTTAISHWIKGKECPDLDALIKKALDEQQKLKTADVKKHITEIDKAAQPTPAATTPSSANPTAPAGFAFIKGGTFDMGCTSEQKDCESVEKPVTRVTVSDFYLGKYEVTFDEYDAFCNATGRDKPSDHGRGRGQRPVINVSWNDAIAYCNWRSEKEGLTKVYTISGDKVTANWNANGYRLPTEAEWEYAARSGGKAVLFGNGENVADPKEINFNASTNYKKPYSVAGEYRQKTVPVGSLNSPNALGLHDMSGNVWEWCWDWFDIDHYAKSNNSRDPRGPDSGSYRVYRGGSWLGYPVLARIAFRIGDPPGYRYSDLGFRLARAVR
jgi:formylglycine-generating enzyme required for sulfatase activity